MSNGGVLIWKSTRTIMANSHTGIVLTLTLGVDGGGWCGDAVVYRVWWCGGGVGGVVLVVWCWCVVWWCGSGVVLCWSGGGLGVRMVW